jgi:hypothetical protein
MQNADEEREGRRRESKGASRRVATILWSTPMVPYGLLFGLPHSPPRCACRATKSWQTLAKRLGASLRPGRWSSGPKWLVAPVRRVFSSCASPALEWNCQCVQSSSLFHGTVYVIFSSNAILMRWSSVYTKLHYELLPAKSDFS